MEQVLGVVSKMRKRLDLLRERLQQMEDSRARLTAELSDMPRSKVIRSRIEDLTVMIIDGQRELSELETVYQECSEEFCTMLSRRVTDLRQQEVLIDRYVLNLEYKKIANRMGYSVAHIYRLHRDAMALLKR